MSAEKKKKSDKKVEDKGWGGLNDTLIKSFGVNVFKLDGSLESGIEREFFKSGFDNLDIALNGGLAKGHLIEMYGVESTGKTTFALQIARNIIEKYDRDVLYIDQEFALDPDWVQLLLGDDNYGRMAIVQPDFLEQIGDIIVETLERELTDFIIIDTWGSAMPKKQFEGDSGDEGGLGLKARVESLIFKKLKPLVGRAKATVLILNQMRFRNIAPGAPKPIFVLDSAGGNGMRHFMDERIFLKRVKKEKSADGEIVGQKVTVEIKKNKCGQAYKTAVLKFDSGTGFDPGWSFLMPLVAEGKIKQAGGYWQYEGKNYRYSSLVDKLYYNKEVEDESDISVKG